MCDKENLVRHTLKGVLNRLEAFTFNWMRKRESHSLNALLFECRGCSEMEQGSPEGLRVNFPAKVLPSSLRDKISKETFGKLLETTPNSTTGDACP